MTTMRVIDDAKRRAAFRITDDDLDLLAAHAADATRLLPGLLDDLGRLDVWPETRAALNSAAVREACLAHWSLLVAGRLDEAFIGSAERLARVFHARDIPAAAATVVHAVMFDALIDALGLRARPRRRLFRRRD